MFRQSRFALLSLAVTLTVVAASAHPAQAGTGASNATTITDLCWSSRHRLRQLRLLVAHRPLLFSFHGARRGGHQSEGQI